MSIFLLMLALVSYGQRHHGRGHSRSCRPAGYRPPVVYVQPPPVIRYQQPTYCAQRWIWVPIRDLWGRPVCDRFGNIRYHQVLAY